jgi:phosphoribosylaminoimidazole-succinocarboxamide synthase
LSIKIFESASALAEKSGLILADTKFEFGVDPSSGEITLGDEVLTPDSSRFWAKRSWLAGDRRDSFDKQIVRNWLADNWSQVGEPPRLPAEIVAQTQSRYAELVERLTGEAV